MALTTQTIGLTSAPLCLYTLPPYSTSQRMLFSVYCTGCGCSNSSEVLKSGVVRALFLMIFGHYIDEISCNQRRMRITPGCRLYYMSQFSRGNDSRRIRYCGRFVGIFTSRPTWSLYEVGRMEEHINSRDWYHANMQST